MDEVAALRIEPQVDGVDEQLALAARTDPEAFGELYRRHRLAVFRYLSARTSSADDAEDLTAVTFERALAAIERYRPSGGGVLAWLFRIARNAAIDASRRRTPEPLAGDVGDALASDGSSGTTLEEARSTLRDVIRSLPLLQEEAIKLRYAGRLTAREIGAVIGKSEAATQKLLSRALITIRENYRVDD